MCIRDRKDIDWLLGELAKKFDHFQGATYTMVDITELLEGATGKSWDRFFDERLNGTELLPPSEFSTSDLFGIESNGAGGKKLVVLSLIHISEPTRLGMISYAVF